jgi:type II secretory pathway component GspD/PulD (secretin)
MKRYLSIALVGLVASSLAAFAQTNTPAGETAAAPASVTTTNDVAPPAAAPDATPPAEAGAAPAPEPMQVAQADQATPPAAAPVADPATATNAPTAEPVPAANATAADPALATNAPVATSEASLGTNAPAAGDAAAEGSPNTLIPLIVMDDVPLTDAIKNLARQAGLNYMLDPKVNFGQIGPDGKPVPQPVVSIRWENVTAEQALTALLGNHDLQLTEDPKSKIARITVKDPAAPDPLVTKVIQLKYAGPTNILSTVQNTLTDKRSKVVADVRTSQLVILATEKELVDTDVLIESLDKPTRQVLIEARLLETSMNPSTRKGMDWSGTLEAQHMAFGNNLQTKPVDAKDSVNPPLSTLWPKLMLDTAKGFNPGTAFLDADGVSAVLSFLNKYGDTKVISTPRSVTLDNETANIEVTRASPIINVTPGTVQVSGGSQITYTNLGVLLKVTPRISANNFVNLKVTPEVSRVAGTVTRVVNNGRFEVDEYDIRKMDTRVMIPSGNTLVLGGLVQDDVRTGNTKVPVLGDIPILGYAFRADSKDRQKSNLIIFLTPTIIQDEDFQKTQTDYLKTPVPTQDTIEPEWTAWDSGQPKDWSKKKSSEKQAAAFDEQAAAF